MINKDNLNNIIPVSLDDIISDSFSRYAKYIIQDRALPDIRDGLKPVQRRILYAMHELGMFHDKPFKKSARTVGEVIGKYHPHGDSAIYEAMVRMSQDWKNNFCLIEMHGNNGSIDGDPAAAMRYTEARLSKIGQIMLDGIDKDIISFISNFDDSETEPTVLPSLFPNILVNGASGIAAGYATNIPPFNFIELKDAINHRINFPNCQLKSIIELMPGPDFPTGGIIQGKEGIENIYNTGKGKINIISKLEQVEQNNFYQLLITEIPFDVNKSNLVKSIDEIRLNNKVNGIIEVRDESNKEGVLIVIEIEKNCNIDAIKAYLLKNTQLQISYNANLVVIKDRKPINATIFNLIDSYIEWANHIFITKANYDYRKFLKRKNIITGINKALSDVDALIKLIRYSSSREQALEKVQAYFNLNNEQTNAIVSLRLYNLTNFDSQKLLEELQEIEMEIIEQELIINDQSHRNNLIKSNLNSYVKIFNNKRKSKIEANLVEYEFSHLDVMEVVTRPFCITKYGYLKSSNEKVELETDLLKFKYKEDDYPIFFISSLNSLQHLILITSKARLISIPCYKIKSTLFKSQYGIHLNEFITLDIDEFIIFCFPGNKMTTPNFKILLVTKNGFVKQMICDEIFISSNIKQQNIFKLKNNDELVHCSFIKSNDTQFVTFTSNGMALRYPLDDIPLQSKNSSGVINIKLKDVDHVVDAFSNGINDYECYIFTNKGHKKVAIDDIQKFNRGTFGKMIYLPSKQQQLVVKAIKIEKGLLYNVIENYHLNNFIPTSKLSLISDKINPIGNFQSYSAIIDFCKNN
ncbi:MAG: DNA topoisomerase IV subunit A [Mycoplasmoidaceae bacterium]